MHLGSRSLAREEELEIARRCRASGNRRAADVLARAHRRMLAERLSISAERVEMLLERRDMSLDAPLTPERQLEVRAKRKLRASSGPRQGLRLSDRGDMPSARAITSHLELVTNQAITLAIAVRRAHGPHPVPHAVSRRRLRATRRRAERNARVVARSGHRRAVLRSFRCRTSRRLTRHPAHPRGKLAVRRRVAAVTAPGVSTRLSRDSEGDAGRLGANRMSRTGAAAKIRASAVERRFEAPDGREAREDFAFVFANRVRDRHAK